MRMYLFLLGWYHAQGRRKRTRPPPKETLLDIFSGPPFLSAEKSCSLEQDGVWFLFPHMFSLRPCRSSSVNFFDFGGGKFGGNFVGIFLTHKIKALKFRENQKKIRANFVLQSCHPNHMYHAPRNYYVNNFLGGSFM